MMEARTPALFAVFVATLVACSSSPPEDGAVRSTHRSAPTRAPGGEVIPPGHEARIAALIRPLPAGARLERITIAPAFITYVVAAGGETFSVALTTEGTASVEPDTRELGSGARSAARAIVAQLEARADAAFFAEILTRPRADVRGSSPPAEAPSSLAPSAVVASGLFSGVLLLFAVLGPDRRRRVALLSAGALVPLFGWVGRWAASPRAPDEGPDRELTQYIMIVAAVIAAFGVVRLARALSARALPPAQKALLLDAGAVLGSSLVVRLALTRANILTDGGTLGGRLFTHMTGFGAMNVLIDALPGADTIDGVLVLFPSLSALAPVGVYFLGRALFTERRFALAGALALAALPLHAALFSSDFETGPTLALTTTGAGMLLFGLREGERFMAALGAALIAFGLWGRPEALVVGLPVAATLLAPPRRWWSDPRLAAPLVWLGVVALARTVVLREQTIHSSGFSPLGPIASTLWGTFATNLAVVPPWLWLSPVALVWLIRRDRAAAAIVACGAVGGFVPLQFAAVLHDPTRSFLELFRYGAFVMPWVALLAGAGLLVVIDRALRALRLAPRETRVRAALPSVLSFAVLAATPILSVDYLRTRYGPSLEREVFLDAATHVQPGCWLVAPDDVGERAEQDGNTIEILRRYSLVLEDEARSGRAAPFPVDHVIGVSALVDALARPGSGMPSAQSLVAPEAPRSPDGGPDCFYFFWGLYCDDGIDGRPPASCRALLDALETEPVYERTFEYHHHRSVTRPDIRRKPLFDPARRLVLFRLGERRHHGASPHDR